MKEVHALTKSIIDVVLSLIGLQKENEDRLGLEKHLHSWPQKTRLPIALVRYETVWPYQDDISNFLGFDLKLPPYKKRMASNDDNIQIRAKLQKTYMSLSKKLATLEDIFIINKSLL